MTRKSKREIERALEDIEDAGPGAIEKGPLTLAEALSYEIETVHEDPHIIRIVEKNELRRLPESSEKGPSLQDIIGGGGTD